MPEGSATRDELEERMDADEDPEIQTDGGVDQPDSIQLERRRWDGDLDALDYETEDFEGGESVVLRYEDHEGNECTVHADCGGYQSHNSWLIMWEDGGGQHTITVNGIVRRDVPGDNYDTDVLGRAIEVRGVGADGGSERQGWEYECFECGYEEESVEDSPQIPLRECPECSDGRLHHVGPVVDECDECGADLLYNGNPGLGGYHEETLCDNCYDRRQSLVTDGGEPQEVGSVRFWDHEECPRDGCEGDLQQQDRFNVECLSCESVFSHCRRGDRHWLQDLSGEKVAEKEIATDGGVDSTGIAHFPTAEDASEYPILTSERLLGARVTVSQRDTLRHEYQGRTTRESAVEVHGVDADPYLDQRDRKYIAAWARRVLFGGDRRV